MTSEFYEEIVALINDVIDLRMSEERIAEMKGDILDIVFAVAMASGAKPEDVVKGYNKDALIRYAQQISLHVEEQINVRSGHKKAKYTPKINVSNKKG